MLARANRIVAGDDYKRVVRRGRRSATPHAMIYRISNSDGGAVRFGFIVSKTVGNAVIRNRVRRRLKAIASSLLGSLPPGSDVVVRALPASAQASWATLNTEISDVVNKGMARS